MAKKWLAARVFISSSFKDMQAERNHLALFLSPKLQKKLTSRRIYPDDVDILWGVP